MRLAVELGHITRVALDGTRSPGRINIASKNSKEEKNRIRKFVDVWCLKLFVAVGAALASEQKVGRTHPLEYKYSRPGPCLPCAAHQRDHS